MQYCLFSAVNYYFCPMHHVFVLCSSLIVLSCIWECCKTKCSYSVEFSPFFKNPYLTENDERYSFLLRLYGTLSKFRISSWHLELVTETPKHMEKSVHTEVNWSWQSNSKQLLVIRKTKLNNGVWDGDLRGGTVCVCEGATAGAMSGGHAPLLPFPGPSVSIRQKRKASLSARTPVH